MVRKCRGYETGPLSDFDVMEIWAYGTPMAASVDPTTCVVEQTPEYLWSLAHGSFYGVRGGCQGHPSHLVSLTEEE